MLLTIPHHPFTGPEVTNKAMSAVCLRAEVDPPFAFLKSLIMLAPSTILSGSLSMHFVFSLRLMLLFLYAVGSVIRT